MEDPLAGVELPLLDVLEDHEVALGDDVARVVVVARERLDADLEPVDDLLRAPRALAVDADVGVVGVVGEEGGHAVPVAQEVRLPVPLDDLPVARLRVLMVRSLAHGARCDPLGR